MCISLVQKQPLCIALTPPLGRWPCIKGNNPQIGLTQDAFVTVQSTILGITQIIFLQFKEQREKMKTSRCAVKELSQYEMTVGQTSVNHS